MMQSRQTLPEFFGADGPLVECLDGFAPRPEQLAMAEEVATAIAAGNNLVVEAGTGTGKTLAYLVPALLWASESLFRQAPGPCRTSCFIGICR